MKTSKKVLALLLVFVLCVSAMVGCGKKEEPAATETTTAAPAAAETTTAAPAEAADPTAEPLKVALLLQNTWNPFFTEIEVGLQAAVDALNNGSTLATYDGNTDIAKQINDLEDCIAAGMDIIFVNSTDSTGLDAGIKKAKEAGIIVIAIDTPQDDPSSLTTTVASDNYKAGVLCAENLAKELGETGELGAYLRSTSKVAALRGSGFLDTIEANYPNMEVVNKQEGTAGSADAALPCMENVLQGTPNVTGMFALNDPSAQGCISAIKAAGKIDKIKVVAVDGSKEAKALILAGEQLGSSAQFPGEMGRIGFESALKALAGETVDAETLIEVVWCDKSNAATMKNYDYDN